MCVSASLRCFEVKDHNFYHSTFSRFMYKGYLNWKTSICYSVWLSPLPITWGCERLMCFNQNFQAGWTVHITGILEFGRLSEINKASISKGPSIYDVHKKI